MSEGWAPVTASVDQRGFTLLEVMVSLAIFSLLSIASYQFLQSLTLASAVTLESEEQRWQLETSLLILEQDMRYLMPRSTRGSAQPLVGSITDTAQRYPALTNSQGTFLEFSRGGLSVGASAASAGPARVVYRLEQGAQGLSLERVVYRALDLVERSPFQRQELLTSVQAATLRFMGEDGAWRSAWPPKNLARQEVDLERLPVAIEFAWTWLDQVPRRRVISLR